MRLESIEYILEVAKCNSISAAARNLFMQQTTLSAAIKSVENELGYKIFDRQYAGVVLTEQGKLFLNLAEPMLEYYQLMRELKDSKKEVITLHFNSVLYNLFFYDMVNSLYERFSDELINIKRIHADDLIHIIQTKNNIHVGIGYCDVDDIGKHREIVQAHGFEFIPLLKTELLIFVHQNNILASKEVVEPKELTGQSMILSSYNLEVYRRLELEQYVKSSTVLDFSTPAPLFNSVRKNNMIALSIETNVISRRLSEPNDICGLHIKTGKRTGVYYQHYIVHKKKKELSETEREIISYLCNIFISE